MERKKIIRLHRIPDGSSMLVSADDILHVTANVIGKNNTIITLRDARRDIPDVERGVKKQL